LEACAESKITSVVLIDGTWTTETAPRRRDSAMYVTVEAMADTTDDQMKIQAPAASRLVSGMKNTDPIVHATLSREAREGERVAVESK
jgi:copper(I)-binding protein